MAGTASPSQEETFCIGYRDTSVMLRNAYKVRRVDDMEELLFFALLGAQVILILILIVIALRCLNALVEIREAIKLNVATELRGIHKQLKDIEFHTRKPPSAIED